MLKVNHRPGLYMNMTCLCVRNISFWSKFAYQLREHERFTSEPTEYFVRVFTYLGACKRWEKD